MRWSAHVHRARKWQIWDLNIGNPTSESEHLIRLVAQRRAVWAELSRRLRTRGAHMSFTEKNKQFSRNGAQSTQWWRKECWVSIHSPSREAYLLRNWQGIHAKPHSTFRFVHNDGDFHLQCRAQCLVRGILRKSLLNIWVIKWTNSKLRDANDWHFHLSPASQLPWLENAAPNRENVASLSPTLWETTNRTRQHSISLISTDCPHWDQPLGNWYGLFFAHADSFQEKRFP